MRKVVVGLRHLCRAGCVGLYRSVNNGLRCIVPYRDILCRTYSCSSCYLLQVVPSGNHANQLGEGALHVKGCLRWDVKLRWC